jgi:hypothetical protein
MRYFRNRPDTRLGAQRFNKPWLPPEGFPRKRFFRQLKEAHPQLSDLDAAYLIEDAIYSFDDSPVREPMRSEKLLLRVSREIDSFCASDLRFLRGWAQNQPMTGWHRNAARCAFINDRWLLRRIQQEPD